MKQVLMPKCTSTAAKLVYNTYSLQVPVGMGLFQVGVWNFIGDLFLFVDLQE